MLVVGEGEWRITLDGDSVRTFEVGPEDTVSVPANMWRSFENIGPDRGVLYIASAGDLRVPIEWAPEVQAQF